MKLLYFFLVKISYHILLINIKYLNINGLEIHPKTCILTWARSMRRIRPVKGGHRNWFLLRLFPSVAKRKSSYDIPDQRTSGVAVMIVVSVHVFDLFDLWGGVKVTRR